MRGAFTIFRRELAGLFVTPLGWILMAVALLLNGWLFPSFLESSLGDVNSGMRIALGGGTVYWMVQLLLPPLLTMRMISEESRTGMLEFLLTSPVHDAAVVLGKALAATAFMALLWCAIASYGVVLAALGHSPDWGLLACNLLGAVLVSGLFCAVGLVASALTDAPFLAAFMAFVFSLGLFFVRTLEGPLQSIAPEWTDFLLSKVDVTRNLFGSFTSGAFDSAHFVFFVAWIVVFLFVATRLLEARRWL